MKLEFTARKMGKTHAQALHAAKALRRGETVFMAGIKTDLEADRYIERFANLEPPVIAQYEAVWNTPTLKPVYDTESIEGGVIDFVNAVRFVVGYKFTLK